MPTHQVFLDELPLALPTLRHALESEQKWEDVLSETWKQLIAAAHCTCYPTWHHPILPPGSILEHESSDVELGLLSLCATSAVSEVVREILDFSTVIISYILVVFYMLMHLRRLMSVKDGSNRCGRLLESQFARSTS
jgi:hypothetical protein